MEDKVIETINHQCRGELSEKFGELKMELQNISGKSNVNNNNNNNENSLLLLEILKNRIFSLEKKLIEKDAIINFLLKQKNGTNNNYL